MLHIYLPWTPAILCQFFRDVDSLRAFLNVTLVVRVCQNGRSGTCGQHFWCRFLWNKDCDKPLRGCGCNDPCPPANREHGKHVSQFTAVLRHLGRVLEAEKGSCSKDLLREIRKIKRSCKSTFKEINATVMSRQFRSFVPVRWLFKKSKAKEPEARLDSEQSMLQVMIHTVTVSKLGDMQSK